MNTSNFTEWTREQKEQFAERRMHEMKLKNEELRRRYAEVEDDRIAAENRNSAVTNASKALKKEKNSNAYEFSKPESKIEHAREWDRGKPDKDNWKSPDHHASFKSYRTGHYDRKDNDRKGTWGSYSKNDGDDSWNDHTSAGHQERKNIDRRDTWGGYSRNDSSDHYRHDHASDSMQNRRIKGNYRFKQHDNDQHNMSRLHPSPKRTRGVGYKNNELHRKSQHSYSDEKYKKYDYNRTNSRKRCSYRAHSRSSSRSDSDYMDNNISSIRLSTIKASSLWHNDKISEDQNKQNRVEKWVKSVNKSTMWTEKQFSPEQKDKSSGKSYSKFDRFEHSPDRSSNEDYLPNFSTSGESKIKENSNVTSQTRDYFENKCQNRGPSSYNMGSNYARQCNDGLKKGYRIKRSPHFSSAGSGKNEHFRKQRRFDNRGFKNDDDKNKFSKSKMHDNTVTENDTWNNSIGDSKDAGHEKRNSSIRNSNSDTWNQDGDCWGTAEQSQVDDGIWGGAEQTDIKWRLSDEEADTKNPNRKIMSVVKNISSDTWNDNEFSSVEKNVKTKEKFVVKIENKKESAKSEDPDGIWSDVGQSDINWKIPEAEADSQEMCENLGSVNSNKDEVKSKDLQKQSEVGDGWEDNQTASDVYKSNLNEISQRMDEKCKIHEGMKPDDGVGDAKVVEGGSKSNVETTKFEQSSDALSQKSHKKNAGGSDDGGWSTVSEEGEIPSGEENKESAAK